MMCQELVNKFDLKAYVQQQGAKEIKRGEWVLECPVCHKDKLTVNVQKRMWHCWVCQRYEIIGNGLFPKKKVIEGAGGPLELIQLLNKIDRDKAISLITNASLLTFNNIERLPETEFKTLNNSYNFKPIGIQPPPHWKPITQVLPYMAQRGITMWDAQRLGILYCDEGKYKNRLIFPVWEQGHLVYWQARAMWDAPKTDKTFRKALNPTKENGSAGASEVLMNLEMACKYPRVCLVEGPIDCVHAGNDSVATFGKHLTPIQVAKLQRAGVKAVDLMWDADAKEDMLAVANMLSMVFDLRLVFLPEKDPGSYELPYLNYLRSQGKSFNKRSKLWKI